MYHVYTDCGELIVEAVSAALAERTALARIPGCIVELMARMAK